MNLKKITLLFFIIFTFCIKGFAQQNDVYKCNTMLLDQLNEERYPGWEAQRLQFEKDIQKEVSKIKSSAQKTGGVSAIFKIPVVVHIIHNETSGAIQNANISNQQVFDQIAVLNEDFRRTNADAIQTPLLYSGVTADAEIEFCLANRDPLGQATSGITRTYNSKSPFQYPSDDAYLKSLAYWPSDKYLNIWVCRISYGANKLLGYAQFPSNSGLSGLSADEGSATTDGVVIHFSVFGRNVSTSSNYNLGRTATHEIGHWLGLLHTWGDGDCSVDDNCVDTPNCDSEYYSDKSTCTAPLQCPNTRRMIENYMDYSDDACMNLFTADQKTRIQSAISLSPRRANLINSNGCCTTCPIPPIATSVYTELKVFPNPAQGQVALDIHFNDTTNIDVKIYNYLGKNLYNKENIYMKDYTELIDVSGWADGMYIAVVRANDKKYIQRIIVLN